MCSSSSPKAIVLVVAFVIQMNAVVSDSSVDTDRLALLAIQSKITDDPQGVFRSWNDSLPLCQWQGVTCGRRHQRVTTLDLSDKGLVGSLSPYIGNLSFLRYMNFSINELHGNIPPEIGGLSRLQILALYDNSFTGEIPINITSCSKLTLIDLFNNKLIGGIPPFIGNITSLIQLFLANCLLGGSIPDSFNRLNNLRQLSIGGNDLVGRFPLFIFNLSNLEFLSFPENRLLGHLPSNICSGQPRLQVLEFSINHFSGIFPPAIANCSKLEIFDCDENAFEGGIDIDFGKLQYLIWLTMGHNSIETKRFGVMKYFDSLFNCSNLEVIQLGQVQVRRKLPTSFGNLTKLNILILESKYILGGLPSSIGNLVSLSKLGLAGNSFTGIIPESIGKLQNLKEVLIVDNNFSGIIPRSIGNLSSLIKVYLYGNKLEGTIPSTIGKCKNLILLELQGNNLTGSIPKELFQLSSLSISLDLSQNHLAGVLPQEIGNLKNLGSLDLSDNNLSGELPSDFSNCINLEFLNISNNFFHGSMPLSFSSLRALEYVDLSQNNFSGHVPTYLQQIPLKQLNLSYNDFEGEVSFKGVFANTSSISVVGNPKLCGGIPELQLPICRTKRSRKLSLRVVVAISLSSTVAGLALASFVLFHYCKKKKRENRVDLTGSFKKISYGEIFKATEGFSTANLIGTGGFGSVYKGVLDENGLVVAIKVLNLQRRGGSRSFMAECEALRNIRHRNLVKVITSCSSLDFQGNDFKALVYDFMPNGSLDTWLHSSTTIDHLPHDRLHQLDLVQRISIAKDVACALDYLHYHCGSVVVHRDLKPSNILLDSDMVAHVGDFGLAKILSLDEPHDAYRSNSSHVRGTIGYAPPEYGVGNEVSTSGDIYSYGILLLEMLTGKKPVDPMFREGLSLHSYASSALAGGFVLQIVDPMLLRDDVKERCLISLVEIGVRCSSESPQARMDIGTIIHELFSNLHP